MVGGGGRRFGAALTCVADDGTTLLAAAAASGSASLVAWLLARLARAWAPAPLPAETVRSAAEAACSRDAAAVLALLLCWPDAAPGALSRAAAPWLPVLVEVAIVQGAVNCLAALHAAADAAPVGWVHAERPGGPPALPACLRLACAVAPVGVVAFYCALIPVGARAAALRRGRATERPPLWHAFAAAAFATLTDTAEAATAARLRHLRAACNARLRNPGLSAQTMAGLAPGWEGDRDAADLDVADAATLQGVAAACMQLLGELRRLPAPPLAPAAVAFLLADRYPGPVPAAPIMAAAERGDEAVVLLLLHHLAVAVRYLYFCFLLLVTVLPPSW